MGNLGRKIGIENLSVASSGLKISFTGPSDKMSDDFEFGSDICPMTSVQFGSEISLNDAN